MSNPVLHFWRTSERERRTRRQRAKSEPRVRRRASRAQRLSSIRLSPRDHFPLGQLVDPSNAPKDRRAWMGSGMCGLLQDRLLARPRKRLVALRKEAAMPPERQARGAWVPRGRDPGPGLEVLAELAEGIGVGLAAPDGLAEKGDGGKALRCHLLFVTASTGGRRSGSSDVFGTRFGILASRIFCLARTSRLAIVGSRTRNARAMYGPRVLRATAT